MNPENDLQLVFEAAERKFLSKMSKPGNVERPWDKFSLEHLDHYLEQEFNEYLADHDPEELIDVINVAAFLYLKRTKMKPMER